MASRWRTWDAHFATDILGAKLPFDSLDSIPVGSRGKFRFNIHPSLLVIPTIKISEKSDVKVGGRGRRLHQQNQSKNLQLKRDIPLGEIDDYHQKRMQELHDEEFPALSSTQIESKNMEEIEIETVRDDASDITTDIQFEDADLTEEIQKTETESITFIDTKSLSEDSLVGDDISESKEDCQESEGSFVKALKTTSDVSFTSDDFLNSLEGPEFYILIQNLTTEVDDEAFKETISSFGEIELFLTQTCSDGIHKNVIVKMVDSSHCVWVISCLDGDIYEDGGERLSAKAVEDIISV
jgi:hypothetical protein